MFAFDELHLGVTSRVAIGLGLGNGILLFNLKGTFPGLRVTDLCFEFLRRQVDVF